MKAPARTYYTDDGEGRPVYTRAGIKPSKSYQRAERVLAEAVRRLGTPFDDRSHLPVRRYIARMRLSPSQLALLVANLSNIAAGRCSLIESLHARLGEPVYRSVLFYCHRAALSLLVETPPRSRLDLHDLLPILMAWPGALPPSQQSAVASIIGSHVADAIVGRPFKRRALLPRGGARRS